MKDSRRYRFGEDALSSQRLFGATALQRWLSWRPTLYGSRHPGVGLWKMCVRPIGAIVKGTGIGTAFVVDERGLQQG